MDKLMHIHLCNFRCYLISLKDFIITVQHEFLFHFDSQKLVLID